MTWCRAPTLTGAARSCASTCTASTDRWDEARALLACLLHL